MGYSDKSSLDVPDAAHNRIDGCGRDRRATCLGIVALLTVIFARRQLEWRKSKSHRPMCTNT